MSVTFSSNGMQMALGGSLVGVTGIGRGTVQHHWCWIYNMIYARDIGQEA